jgi:hypothetical protein
LHLRVSHRRKTNQDHLVNSPKKCGEIDFQNHSISSEGDTIWLFEDEPANSQRIFAIVDRREKFVAEALNLSKYPNVDWQIETTYVETHPLQSPKPEERQSFYPSND